MTHRQYQRHRKWDRKTVNAYYAGIVEGTDMFHMDQEPTPPEDLRFDVRFLLRTSRRLEQYIVNCNVARCRGRWDGWEQAREKAENDEWVERGLRQLEAWANRKAA